MRNLRQELLQRQQQGLYRRRKILQGPQGREIILDGRRLLNFCSNDYLGLAAHPEVQQALIRGARQYGTGSGSAHLVNGHSQAHHQLEEALAEFCGQPRALLFSTGYMANLGIAQALMSQSTIPNAATIRGCLIEDKLNHASLLDAAHISNARLLRFLHRDYDSLLKRLARCDSATEEILVCSDTVFSMDGDEADISALQSCCRKQGAWLMLDDAHGFGVLGEQGRGSLSHQHISSHDNIIYMATLGKALGTAGAFVVGSEELIEFLIQSARSYVYTTAMPAAIAMATLASLRLLQTESERQQALLKNIRYFRQLADQAGLQLMPSETAIQPILVGDAERALNISQQLLEDGLHVAAIRPPTVPANTARLRITLRADHRQQDIDQLVSQLCDRVIAIE